MKKRKKISLCTGVGALAAFALWTVLIQYVDVQAIGPHGSTVGFATLNDYVHRLTGVNMALYVLTDWLGLVPIGVALGFAVCGLVQWVKRRKLWLVDASLFVLGGFYIAVLSTYLAFEYVVINYRPVLINGMLEPSYPSSTTLLVLCVIPTAILQLQDRIKGKLLRRCTVSGLTAFSAFMVIGRLLSGVHWISDIIGGILLATAFVSLYDFVLVKTGEMCYTDCAK